jgi:hypothetical protein
MKRSENKCKYLRNMFSFENIWVDNQRKNSINSIEEIEMMIDLIIQRLFHILKQIWWLNCWIDDNWIILKFKLLLYSFFELMKQKIEHHANGWNQWFLIFVQVFTFIEFFSTYSWLVSFECFYQRFLLFGSKFQC